MSNLEELELKQMDLERQLSDVKKQIQEMEDVNFLKLIEPIQKIKWKVSEININRLVSVFENETKLCIGKLLDAAASHSITYQSVKLSALLRYDECCDEEAIAVELSPVRNQQETIEDTLKKFEDFVKDNCLRIDFSFYEKNVKAAEKKLEEIKKAYLK